VSLRTGLVLAHGGEFGFALLALAINDTHQLLSVADSQPILAALVLSMALAPLLIRYNAALVKGIFLRSAVDESARGEGRIATAMGSSRGHVIVCGFGRIGQNMASFLRDAGFDYAALDLEPARVKDAWEAGERVFYGDATHRQILEAAGVTRAKALVISFNDERAAVRILRIARSIKRDLPILVRSHDETSLEPLLDAGATEVVPETLEASLMLGIQLLLMLEVPMEEVVGRVQAARGDRYRRLRIFFRRAEAERKPEAGRDRARLHTVLLPAGAFAVGRRLEELGLEEEGIEINAVRRRGIRGSEPTPDLRLSPGDVLVLAGRPEQLAHAEQRLLRG
jgi:CPA2 family monovalent cation:H+ antiporter-2